MTLWDDCYNFDENVEKYLDRQRRHKRLIELKYRLKNLLEEQRLIEAEVLTYKDVDDEGR